MISCLAVKTQHPMHLCLPKKLSQKDSRTVVLLVMMEQQQPPATGEEEKLRLKEKWLKKMRGSLMVVAVLAASVTYTAGLNPPGGFWQDDQPAHHTEGQPYFKGQGHFAGDPILRDKNYNRYATFLAGNTVAFVQSLVIILLLMTQSTFHGRVRLYLLRVFVVIDVSALVVAYAVGCTRDPYDVFFSIFIILVVGLFCGATTLAMHCYYGGKGHRQHPRLAACPPSSHLPGEGLRERNQ